MRLHRPRRAAFTLAELLVVMSIIIILVSVSAPALKGLMGGRSRSAAVGQMMGLLERARSTALEKGTGVYLGIVTEGGSLPPEYAYARYILFRDRLDTDPGPPNQVYLPLTSWQQLPAGVVFWKYGMVDPNRAEEIDGTVNLFPPVPGALLNRAKLSILRFNAAGAIEKPAAGQSLEIWLREGFYKTSSGSLSLIPAGGTNVNNQPPADRISFARYTGRAQLDTVPPPQQQ